MSNYNAFILDGYVLNTVDGYSFQSAWFDVRNAFGWSITVTFAGGSPSGTLSLNTSNETDIAAPMGFQQATSPGTGSTSFFVPSDQPSRGAQDSVQITGTSKSISTAGTTLYDSGLLFTSPSGMRWIQVQYIGTSEPGTTITSSINFKW